MLLGLVDPPVDAVDVEMIETAASHRTPEVRLTVSSEDVAQVGVLTPVVVGVRPGVVLGAAQVDVVELSGPRIAEQAIAQFAFPVDLTEVQPETPPRVVATTARATANPDSG